MSSSFYIYLINIGLLLFAFIGTLTAFGGDTYIKKKKGLFTKLTRRGWLSLTSILLALLFGIAKENISYREKLEYNELIENQKIELDSNLLQIKSLQKKNEESVLEIQQLQSSNHKRVMEFVDRQQTQYLNRLSTTTKILENVSVEINKSYYSIRPNELSIEYDVVYNGKDDIYSPLMKYIQKYTQNLLKTKSFKDVEPGHTFSISDIKGTGFRYNKNSKGKLTIDFLSIETGSPLFTWIAENHEISHLAKSKTMIAFRGNELAEDKGGGIIAESFAYDSAYKSTEYFKRILPDGNSNIELSIYIYKNGDIQIIQSVYSNRIRINHMNGKLRSVFDLIGGSIHIGIEGSNYYPISSIGNIGVGFIRGVKSNLKIWRRKYFPTKPTNKRAVAEFKIQEKDLRIKISE